MIKITFALIAVLFLSLPAFAWTGTVAKVTDGDTIWVETETQATIIRLYGIDAPEKKQQYGPEATAFLSGLALGKAVSVIEMDTDRYGRSVAIVVLTATGESLQELLLENGAAWVYTSYCKNCNTWKDLEKQAREARQGLWQAGEPVPPWVWRK